MSSTIIQGLLNRFLRECIWEKQNAEVLTVLKSGESDLESVVVDWIASGTESWRKEKTLERIELPKLPLAESQALQEFLTDHHTRVQPGGQ